MVFLLLIIKCLLSCTFFFDINIIQILEGEERDEEALVEYPTIGSWDSNI
jgi:hypothetical protein